MTTIDLTAENLQYQNELLWQLALRLGCDGRALDALISKYASRASHNEAKRAEMLNAMLDDKAMELLGLCDE